MQAEALSLSETLLLQQLQAGDVQAFDTLYHRYAKPLLWKLHKMVKDPEDADELLQELFVKVWEKRAQLEIKQSFEAYLYRIAQRMAIDYFRKLKRQATAFETIQAGTTEAVNLTEDLLAAKEIQSLLDLAIAQLPAQRRKAFILCKIEGKSHQEAAAIMNISPNTVHNHLVKAVNAVKEHMEKSGRTLSPLALLLVLSNIHV